MGIPKYHKWLTERYPDAFAEAQHQTADHVYVDINALLHDVMRHAVSVDGFYQHLFSKLDGLFRVVTPQRSVYLAVDGPASCAKCLTQRQRRRAHAQKDSNHKKRDRDRGKGKGKGKWGANSGQASNLSNNMLTPGVPFMSDLSSGLEYYLASRMGPRGAFARCESATVSGACAVGEGEHKIVSQMLRHAAKAQEAMEPESHVIFSGDADIFLLSLVQSSCRRVRVVSERPDEAGKKGGGGGVKRRHGMMLQVWDAEALAAYLHQELSDSPEAMFSAADEAAVRRDFAFVSLLAGNDYLPELKCMLTPQKIWDQYLTLRRKNFPQQPLVEALPVDGGLPLSHCSGGWAHTLGERGAAFVVEPYEHYAFHIPLLGCLMSAAAGNVVGRGAIRAEEREGVRGYLQGLLWILEMYHHGYCCDFYYVFEKSKHSSAHASLIAKFLTSLEEDEPLEPSRSDQAPMRPLACAMCVLPSPQAQEFLCPGAPSLAPMFSTNHPLLGSINSIERSAELVECKELVASLHKEMMSLRSLGRDDKAVKRQLTESQQRLEQLKKGSGGDIDVVPFKDLDEEVQERCAGRPSLEFAVDVTLSRQPGGEAFPLDPPCRGMQQVWCSNLQYVTGEWPPKEVDAAEAADWDVEDAAEEAVEEAEEAGEAVAEAIEEQPEAQGEDALEEQGDAEPEEEQPEAEVEKVPEQQDEVEAVEEVEEVETPGFCKGEEVEGYWPDDDTWLAASIVKVRADGSLLISWSEDGSESEVPTDYVRRPELEEGRPTKRARR